MDSPEKRFGTVARQLSGHCALLLGWRPPEFWEATPAELASVLEAVETRSGTSATFDRAKLEQLMEQEDG
ncbi:phage tail assembly chaperone [Croceicoccus sp. F390]|uniref:Phage tail assembly chaperone n=1 Tax=Croceicoccus esteveae TaxID=3075597 RepID=A0ABU2ZIU4_9SPHN|nr:phage tail assembly chaperone [Croceicoccus sp. F390]MDT0576532.1 phage tail assembly chaperone [Croceicoccus sp. F390]